MKETFIKPEIQIFLFDAEDTIQTSDPPETPDVVF